ncbi:hypothetical protein GLIP_2228 [Aliiglaciecola lipolytica E3]|uniref:Uncharacterized protein n=1 Tax=Aliiglaciecola lipolytica E3 TaxID=1127673 RepID=K6XT66_9ALTE|nr:hypothetical protein GLIP_2228 [Aliiglaciecola lipolytica E3]
MCYEIYFVDAIQILFFIALFTALHLQSQLNGWIITLKLTVWQAIKILNLI